VRAKEDQNLGLIIGCSVGGAALVIIVVALCCKYRNKRPQPTKRTVNKQPQPTKRTVETPHFEGYNPDYSTNIETNCDMPSIESKKDNGDYTNMEPNPHDFNKHSPANNENGEDSIYDELDAVKGLPKRSPPPLPPQNPPPPSTFPHYDKPQRSRQPTPFSQTLPGYKSPNSDVPPPVPREYKPAAYGNVPSSSGNDNGAYLVGNGTETHEYDVADS